MPACAPGCVRPFGGRPGIGNLAAVRGGSGTRLAQGCPVLLAGFKYV